MAIHGVCVGFFSCEMSKEFLVMRMLARQTYSHLSVMRNGNMDARNNVTGKTYWETLEDGSKQLHDLPILIDDTPNIRLVDLKSKARWMKRRGVKCIFVDYLTLIKHGDTRVSRPERVGEISKSLKSLARELNLPVVVMSQLNRDAEDVHPTLANIRQSGEIEEDADVVMFLHRDRQSDEDHDDIRTELYIAKNRNGSIGKVDLIFTPDQATFREPDYTRGESDGSESTV
jgi:replicative DNA helicase